MYKFHLKTFWISPLALCVGAALMAGNVMAATDSVSQHDELHAPDHAQVTVDKTLTMGAVIDLVFDHVPEQHMAKALDAKGDAYKAQASKLFAGSPELSLRYENDSFASDIGQREYEGILSAPVWMPGQKKYSRIAASSSREQAEQYRVRLRWYVAGQVRELLWQIKMTDQSYRLAEKELDMVVSFKNQVERSVALGERSKQELLLVNQTLLEKQMAIKEAEKELVDSLLAYRSFTGLDVMPPVSSETVATVPAGQDTPPVAYARQVAEVQRAEATAVNKKWATAPTVSLGVKRSRSEYGVSASNTVNVGVSIPIGGRDYNARERAEAASALAVAERDLKLAEREQALLFHEVEHELQTCDLQEKAAKAHWAASETAQSSGKKAYELGEYSLIDFLRVQETHLESIRQYEIQKLECGLAVARHNQAKGVLPQ
ncbi:hypothetical protein GCM10017044_04760 [Kordiimonas sediminis]|uniref:TolC family protein n=1 Tax=Kordiimonas sediminis TaxID=1735581 RepID=A0A919AL87_9PROT|nr:TolC family protein [Kordiimonas sediminis]GHF13726.1 hypothetical protein GCM10017044_04760 [Kordiimonas sediminis]